MRLFGASVRRGFASPAWGLSSLLPFGHVIPPSGGVWDACAVRFRFLSLELKQLAALQARDSAVRRSWDACAASGKVGPVMGLRPLRDPLASPPKHPAGRSFQFPWSSEGTRLELRELPSLAGSVRRSPSAPRNCPSRRVLWVDFVSAKDRSRVIPREECVAHAQAVKGNFL